ncbi:hypothetical protein A4X13_0g7041 [Tilletia indica]|uniref:Peptidase S8/S53 domain-containing protein n=1 Tax=Tilletia indica TaxID=43049 RepID=A0A177TU67_9BASI|nr:hypothetical protein A4X13_0g7041 [Tilletia indica]
MRTLFIYNALSFLVLLSTCLQIAHASQPHALANARDPGDAIDGMFIVEFHNTHNESASRERGLLTSALGDILHLDFAKFLSDLAKPINFTTLFEFANADLFLGISLKLDDPNDVETLKSYKGTKAVHPVRRIKLPQDGPAVPVKTTSRPRATKPNTSGPTSPTSPASPTSPVNPAAINSHVFEPHAMMGITELHQEGYYGAGQVLGVIDTGVDYTHQGLNGGKPSGTKCFGEGCPIIGGFAFIDDDGNRVSSPDPFCDCAGEGGHGTHVAGVIIGNDTARNYLGVAPKAKLKVYRVFGCSDSTSTDVLMAAMQKAYTDKVDIISMSIAGLGGWPEDIVSRLASRIIDLGVPIIAANGNEGQSGLFYASHPASAHGATGVGSVQNKVLTGYSATVVGQNQSLAYVTANPFIVNSTATKLQVFDAASATGQGGSSCSQYDDDVPDLSNMLVLIERSFDCGPKDQIKRAADRGAKSIFFYMPEGEGLRTIDTFNYPLPQVAVIDRTDALSLVQAAKSGKVLVDFKNSAPTNVADDVGGGFMSYFSAYGPSWEGEMASGFTAVGGNVLSTWPVKQGSYAIASGTSTATPMVAGAYALYQGARAKKASPAAIRASFASTSVPVPFSSKVSALDTVARQGAGTINVYSAFHSITTISPDRLNLNDSQYLNMNQAVTITNNGNQSQSFSMIHLPAATVHALAENGKGYYNPGPVAPSSGEQAAVSFSPLTFTLAPQQVQVVKLSFTVPSENQKVLPVYSGFVKAVSDKAFGNVSVPYLGVAGRMSDIPILNITTSYDNYLLPGLIDPSFGFQINDDKQVFTLEDQNHQPALLFSQIAGTLAWSVDLISANSTFNGTIPLSRRGLHARAPFSHDTHRFRQVSVSRRQSINPSHGPQVLGRVRGGETLARDSLGSYSTILVNQTYTDEQGVQQAVPDGQYRVLLRVLKLRGDPSDEGSYESYVSHAFTVQRNTPH